MINRSPQGKKASIDETAFLNNGNLSYVNKHNNIVVAQTYIKEKYRKLLLEQFIEAQFILINTEDTIREKRLASRKIFPLDNKYAKKMCQLFDTPTIDHLIITNNSNGEEQVKKQITSILLK